MRECVAPTLSYAATIRDARCRLTSPPRFCSAKSARPTPHRQKLFVSDSYERATPSFPHNGKHFCDFHTVENNGPFFPRNGKTFRRFSTQWKNIFHTVEKTGQFFHTMEKLFGSFPHNGKNLSTLWKTRISGCFGEFSGCSPRAVERSTRRPLSIVERDRPKRPRKRRPPQAVSVLSRSRFGCSVGRGPFSGCEVGSFSRSQMRRGRCARSEDLLRGLLKFLED